MINIALSQDLPLRIKRIRTAMAEESADAILLNIGVNLFYTTGSFYSGYFYLPIDGEPLYFLTRTAEIGHETISIRKPELIPDELKKRNIAMPKKILLEADELTYNEYTRLAALFPDASYGNATQFMRRIRMVKTDYEIAQTRISARKHADVYAEIKYCYEPNMTDLMLQKAIETRMRHYGSLGIFRTFGRMDSFMGTVLTGDNAGTPSPYDFSLGGGGLDSSFPLGCDGTLLAPGMAALIDMAGNFTAYQTDMSRTFSVGELPEIAYLGHETSKKIDQMILSEAKPGVSCAELYNKAFRMVEEVNLTPYFMGDKLQAKFIGHGIGIQINELPVLTPRSKDLLQQGMIFAVEPKFVFPEIGGVGIENSFLVTEKGVEKLTIFEEDIIDFTK